MKITRRNILLLSLLPITQYFINLKSAFACGGYGARITRIRSKYLNNVNNLGHSQYLDHYYPDGYEFSDKIRIHGFTNTNRESINIKTNNIIQGEKYIPETAERIRLKISLENLERIQHCSSIKIIHQINTGSGPCFEVASYNFSELSLPYIGSDIKFLSGENSSFFIIAEVAASNGDKSILVSNIYPIKAPNCFVGDKLEIIYD